MKEPTKYKARCIIRAYLSCTKRKATSKELSEFINNHFKIVKGGVSSSEIGRLLKERNYPQHLLYGIKMTKGEDDIKRYYLK